MAEPDHLNVVERKIIDNLRTGTYTSGSVGSTATAWDSGDVTVFGQFPETEDALYPCIISEMTANGIEQQFTGQTMNTGEIGELYGVSFKFHIVVDRDSTITVNSVGFKQRRLLNYLMLSTANILMDCDFSGTDTEVVERHYTGFQDMGYNPDLEVWAAVCSMIIVFANDRPP
jgi:hypothetical protein|tara:strand:+ start:234 stop:752 length:519 start_codon:yes stop_codon:yes gene_type:complete